MRKIDLLTVVEQELRRISGLNDADVMSGALGISMRRNVLRMDAALVK